MKHIRAAALAAALLPLASVAAAPAQAQEFCPSGACTVTGVVWSDTNNNGFRDAGEPGIEGAKVSVCLLCDGSDTVETETSPDGTFSVLVRPRQSLAATVAVLIPTETQPSPSNVPGDESKDSDGVPNGAGYSVVTLSTAGRGH